MKSHTETAMEPDMLNMLVAAGEDAVKVIGIASSADDPAKVVGAIDAYVYAWQKGKLPKKSRLDADDAPYALGSLWGQQLVRKFGWHWATITFHEHGDSQAPGVISPNASMAVYPIHFVLGCLQDSDVDATILLSYNMLVAGDKPDVKPKEYSNLMELVHRIVPRG